MISLIEHCFSHPLTISEQRKKRGKNYLYSLLKYIKADGVVKYKSELKKLSGKEVTIEDLWQEIENKNKPLNVNKTKEEVNSEQLLPYINESFRYDKCGCTLPSPHKFITAEKPTNEEKNFIQFQVFQNKEAYSAGSYLPMSMSINFSPDPYSVQTSQVVPTHRFEEFSEFMQIGHHA